MLAVTWIASWLNAQHGIARLVERRALAVGGVWGRRLGEAVGAWTGRLVPIGSHRCNWLPLIGSYRKFRFSMDLLASVIY